MASEDSRGAAVAAAGLVVVVVVVAAIVFLDRHRQWKGGSRLAKRTFVYKEVDGVELRADVYGQAEGRGGKAIVWLHGGALIFGSRRDVPEHLRELCLQEGYLLIAPDYRLAPETKLPEIVHDVLDAIQWVRREGPALFGSNFRALVVAGESAGGYLALSAGAMAVPRVTAVVSYSGYGDLTGNWYTEPSVHYRETVPSISRREALAVVGRGVPVDTTWQSAEREGRTRYYLYLRQNGLWPTEVTGFDLASESEEVERYCPVRQVAGDYPPTLLIHGMEDEDVPYRESVSMAQALSDSGVPHELILVPGAGHRLVGGGGRAVAKALARAQAFIKRSEDPSRRGVVSN